MQPVARREADLEQLPTGSPRTAIGRQLIPDPEGSRPLILSVRLLSTPCTSKDTSEGDDLFLRLAGIFVHFRPRVSVRGGGYWYLLKLIPLVLRQFSLSGNSERSQLRQESGYLVLLSGLA